MSEAPLQEQSALGQEASGVEKPPRRHVLLYALIAALALFQGALAAFVYWQYSQQPDSEGSAELAFYESQLESLSAQQEALALRLETLENSATLQQEGGGALDRFNLQQQTLAELQEQVTALKEAQNARDEMIGPMQGLHADELLQLSAELRSLRAQIETKGEKRWQEIQLLTAFDRLQEQILQEEPYDKALAAFQLAAEPLAQSSEWLMLLRPFAHDGIASWDLLQSQFDAARNAVLESGTQEASQTDAGLWKAMASNIAQLVKIRKTGPQHQGNDAQAVLARAAFALEQQDVEGTLRELQALDTQQRSAFDEFTQALNGRQQVLGLLPDIRDYLLARVARKDE